MLFIHCGGFVAWRGVAPRFCAVHAFAVFFLVFVPSGFGRVPGVLADALRELRHVIPT